MKIAVVGAGAMGSLFGGLLAENEEVWLLDPVFEEHVKRINEKGLKIVEEGGTKTTVQISATTDVKEIGEVDLILIFVKAPDTEGAIKGALPMVKEETKVLSLQNGLGITELLKKYVPGEKIFRGVTSHGSTLIGPGKIRHAGKGETVIGEAEPDPKGDSLEKIIKVFEEAGLEVDREENIEKVVWDKLLINIGINALTAIFKVKNGTLVEDNDLREIMRATVSEAVEVARRCGLKVDKEETLKKVEKVCKMTAENQSSMLQDLKQGGKTEIDFLNKAIVEKGREKGIESPLNTLLTRLVERQQGS